MLAEGGFERLADIAQHRYLDPRGESHPFLTPGEMDALKLPRGSLTAQERLEIESHVVEIFDLAPPSGIHRLFHKSDLYNVN